MAAPTGRTDRTLNLSRLIDAPRELVFEVWSRPAHLARWWGPNDFTLPTCEQDFRTGGAYRFCMRAPDGSDHWVWGVYHEIIAPERLVFTWQRQDEPGLRHKLENRVTVTLAEEGHQTRLTLRQTEFQTVADCDGHQGGWSQCLDRLVHHVIDQIHPPHRLP